jgi:hypothetical protein
MAKSGLIKTVALSVGRTGYFEVENQPVQLLRHLLFYFARPIWNYLRRFWSFIEPVKSHL